MPFRSDRQRRYMYAMHPKIAKRWAEEAKRRKSQDRPRLKMRARGKRA